MTDLRGMNAAVEDYCHTADEMDAAEITAHEDGKKVGAAAERASIVAWLLRHPNLSVIMREHIVGQLGRGEHAQPEPARREDGGEAEDQGPDNRAGSPSEVR